MALRTRIAFAFAATLTVLTGYPGNLTAQTFPHRSSPALLAIQSPPPPVPLGAASPVQIGRYCTVCPRHSRIDEDLTQFLMLSVLAGAGYSQTAPGLLHPDTASWKRNMGSFRFYDGDQWYTDAIAHPVAATATYLTLRERGYSRWESAVFLFSALAIREVGVKAWSTPTAIDDPLIFTASGILLGTLIEEFTPWRRYFAYADPDHHLPGQVSTYWSPTRISVTW